MSNVVSIQSQLTQEVVIWQNAIRAAGGGFEWNSIAIANQFIRSLRNKSYYGKIKYLLPMLGAGINAARVPLIDTFSVGIATNGNMVDADFSQSVGLTGNGTNKYLDTLVSPNTIGVTGGIGFWNIGLVTSGDYRAGATNGAETIRYLMDLRSTSTQFAWGSISNVAVDLNQAITANYYGQQSASNSRILYRNAISIATNSVNDGTGPISTNVWVMAGNINNTGADYANGTCGVFYLTDGTLTAVEITDFDTILRSYLFGPTGKQQS